MFIHQRIYIVVFIVTFIGYIAQWLERLTADQQVPGSNPGVPSLVMHVTFRILACLLDCTGLQKTRRCKHIAEGKQPGIQTQGGQPHPFAEETKKKTCTPEQSTLFAKSCTHASQTQRNAKERRDLVVSGPVLNRCGAPRRYPKGRGDRKHNI